MMKRSGKYRQTIIPSVDTPKEWNQVKLQQLRKIILDLIRKEYAGRIITNTDTELPIRVSVTSARKTAL
ncbi:MAG: hypothetical protein KBT57_07300, partial [bacterium]|nr:hypothetical protein [Candidatus Limimorpha equi]